MDNLQKIVYIAMPLTLKSKEKGIVKLLKKKFTWDYPEYEDHSFFNPFEKINQEKNSDQIMCECFKTIKKPETKAVLYVLPFPIKIDLTVTVGAISECDLALKINKPVFICTVNKKPLDIFEINHLDELMNKFNLKAPTRWFENFKERELDISNKFRDDSAK